MQILFKKNFLGDMEKPGFCLNIEIPAPMRLLCFRGCRHDLDCPLFLKCCSIGCFSGCFIPFPDYLTYSPPNIIRLTTTPVTTTTPVVVV